MSLDTPVEIRSLEQIELKILWADGHESLYPFRYLRQNCRCALCVHEWTREKTLNPESVPLELKALKIIPRGNYALSFDFSDNHTTGIYSFEHLRQLCPCPECGSNRP